MGKHRVGIILGFIVTALGGGAFGYFIGKNSPEVVATTLNIAPSLAPAAAAALVAIFAVAIWGIGELISGIFGFVERQAIIVRLILAIAGSAASVISSSLSLIGVTTFVPKPDSLFAYGPIATGLGSVALALHAVLHQIHLNRLGN